MRALGRNYLAIIAVRAFYRNCGTWYVERNVLANFNRTKNCDCFWFIWVRKMLLFTSFVFFKTKIREERETHAKRQERFRFVRRTDDSWEMFARGREEGREAFGGLEGVQEIEKLQLIIFVPTGDQQAREVVLAQAHLRRLRHLRQTVRDGGWHATRRSLVQGVGQAAGRRRAAVAGLKSVKRRCRCRHRRYRRRRRRGRRGGRLPLHASNPLRDRWTAPGPFAFLHPFEIQLPEATLTRFVLGTRQLHEAFVQREIVPNRVLSQ